MKFMCKLCGAVADRENGGLGGHLDKEHSIEAADVKTNKGLLDKFRELTDTLVVVVVRGGIAEVLHHPKGITVEIRDYDDDSLEDEDVCEEEDGAVVSVYGPEVEEGT